MSQKKKGTCSERVLEKDALSLAALDEAISGSGTQKKNQKSRRLNRASGLILPIVSANPSISINSLLKEQPNHDEVDETSERVIWFADGESFNVKLLPSPLSLMKKAHKRTFFFLWFFLNENEIATLIA